MTETEVVLLKIKNMLKNWSDKKKIIWGGVILLLVVVIYHRKDIANFLKNGHGEGGVSRFSASPCSGGVQDAKFGCGGSVSNATNIIVPEVVPPTINIY